MFIRLTYDQVSSFWDLIKEGLVHSNEIPEEFRQDYYIYALTKLLSGSYQAWIYYDVKDEEKELVAIAVTGITNRSFQGLKVLEIVSMYGKQFITEGAVKEMIESAEQFAKANQCKMIIANYSLRRVREMLDQAGFKEYKTTCSKMVGD